MYGNSPYSYNSMGMGGYSNMNGYGGLGGGYNNLNNQMPNNQPQMSSTLQVIYGVLSGSQSLLSIAGSVVDIAYFFKTAKYLLFDFIVYLLKLLYRLVKYLITFRWAIDLIKKTGQFSQYCLLKTVFKKSIFSTFQVLIILGKLTTNTIINLNNIRILYLFVFEVY